MARPDDPSTRHTSRVPPEIDDTEDRMGSVHELDFSERRDVRSGRVGDERPLNEIEDEFPAERVAESGMTGGEALSDSLHEDGVTMDDMSPDTLIPDDGARDPNEPGGFGPVDQDLREVDEDEICGGNGLDEAELARSAPLDGEPWTDDVSEQDRR